MSTSTGGRPRAATIYLAECRDRMLDALRRGDTRVHAAESIGCTWSTARRYLQSNPAFAAKCEAAERGEEIEPESAAPAPAPMPIARVVIDAEPVDAAPCDTAKARDVRPAPEQATGLATAYRDRLMTSIAFILDDPDHPHFASIAKMMFPAIYGPGMLRELREVDRELEADPGDKPPRVLVIRVPERSRAR